MATLPANVFAPLPSGFGRASSRPQLVKTVPTAREAIPAERVAEPRARYGEAPRSWKTLAGVVALHVALVGGLLTAKVATDRAPPPSALRTFDVLPPAPPPEASPPEPIAAVAPPVAPVIAPPPLVRTPTPPPVVQVASEPPVTPVQAPRAATTVAATPAPAAPSAAPAPITPPDFQAAQLNNPAPAYPYLSRRAREEGVVMLRVLVSEAGRAGEVLLQGSSGSSRLDQAALATVKRWRFLPGRQAGRAIAAWVLVPVTFALNGR